MDLRYDPNLVLDLPLYELDSASFISRGKHGHLATVTGALWTPQGRSFDGTDDFISVPDNDVWDSADFTLLIWAKQNAFAGSWWQRAFIAHDTTGGAVVKWLWGHDGTKTAFDWRNPAGSGFGIGSDAWTLSAGIWYCIGLTRIGSAFTFYKDGLPNGTATNATSLGNNNQPLTIGWAEGSPNKTYNGIIGEVWAYNRALTPLEIQHNYLATKWRYG